MVLRSCLNRVESMKVLWIEDQEPVRDMLNIAADKAARARVQIDLVLAHTLMEAERRLRLERFDLVITELTLPDSYDGDMTIARIANMGGHRIAVSTATPDRDKIVETARTGQTGDGKIFVSEFNDVHRN